MKGVFITGVGTEIGKTVASAIVAKAINADYWKPIQAGELENSDTMKVDRWAGCNVFPERYRLKDPMSPHAAANRMGIEIRIDDFRLPESNRPVVVEGAGGVMVPINQRGDMIIDVIQKLELPAIVVSRYYLGSINHTVLTVEALQRRGIAIEGILFNGVENTESRDAILQVTGCRNLGLIEETETIAASFIDEQAQKLTALHGLKGKG